MSLKIQHFVIIITMLSYLSCRQERQTVTSITGKELLIHEDLPSSDSIEAFVKPYREHLNSILDSALAYAPRPITRTDGELNSSEGNLMADIVMQETNPIVMARTGREIDFVMLNHGGIRSLISEGDVTARTAYEVMPFENTIVILGMKGKAVRDLVDYLVKSGEAHPISGLQVRIGKDHKLRSFLVQGMPFDENKMYYVATSDYLAKGGDYMDFFKSRDTLINTGYYLRNAMIDHFKKVDTLRASVDDRYIQID